MRVADETVDCGRCPGRVGTYDRHDATAAEPWGCGKMNARMMERLNSARISNGDVAKQ